MTSEIPVNRDYSRFSYLLPSYIHSIEDLSIEETIRRELPIPLLKIGSIVDQIGGGFLAIDDVHWMNAFAKLALAAKVILLIPWPTPGSEMEIKFLVENKLLSRVVFVIPSEKHIKSDTLDDVAKSIWIYMLMRMKEIGLDFPKMGQGNVCVFSCAPASCRVLKSAISRRSLLLAVQYVLGHKNAAALLGNEFEYAKNEENLSNESEKISLKI